MTGGLDNPIATGGTALVASVLIQALKNSDWATWFNRETSKANLLLSVVVAAATTAGIHWTYDGATGLGTIVFSSHQLWSAIVQWATQHGMYKQFIVPSETLGEIRALIQRALPPPISQPEAKVEATAPAKHSTIRIS